jgi:two-component system chemotaxis sensor kinase CheA
MNEFIEQFLIECRELVAEATDDLLALEDAPQDRERLDGAFRAFHTLKGAAGIVEFQAMGRALHAAEDVLSDARGGTVPVTPALIGDALTCLDQVVQWLDETQGGGAFPGNADEQADAIVRRFAGDGLAATGPAPDTDPDWAEALLQRHEEVRTSALTALRYRPEPDAFFGSVDPLGLLESLPDLLALEMRPATPWPPLEALDPYACNLHFLALLAAPSERVAGYLDVPAETIELVSVGHAPDPAGEAGPAIADSLLEAQLQMLLAAGSEPFAGRIASAALVSANVLRQANRGAEAARLEALARQAPDPQPFIEALRTIIAGDAVVADPEPRRLETVTRSASEPARALRVEASRVDALVNLTGEMMVATNALGHLSALAQSGADPKLLSGLIAAQHAQFQRLVGELQRSVLNIRVLPLRHVFQRFPKLVRELVIALGKPARLVTEGDEVEADKAIVESLFEPLLHVLRNALDHGVEPAPARAAAGKPPSATIVLRARRDGDRVVVEVQDDGGGVDAARVREVALRRGLASGDALSAMSEREIFGLIFAPGFSTSAEVTSLSGRGVGLDAVRAAVERLNGRVEVESRRGEGSLVRFTLPFTVLMLRVMTVEAGGQMFGIPLEAVAETVRLPRERIAAIGGGRAFVLRDRTVPLIDLAATLGAGEAADQADEINVVVASAAGQLGGLQVERLGQPMDVMLKPLDGLLSGTPGVAGATLLGDGRVLLVLDLAELLQ